MRTMILLATAAGLGLGACGHSSAETGRTIQRDFAVGAFDKIEVAGPFNVTVTTGGKPAVHASGDSSLIDKMEVVVEGGALKIRPIKRDHMFNWNFGSHHHAAKVTVSVPMLSEAAIAGSGGIAIDTIKGDHFKGEIAGSGDLAVGSIETGSLELSIAGSGGVKASGKARARPMKSPGRATSTPGACDRNRQGVDRRVGQCRRQRHRQLQRRGSRIGRRADVGRRQMLDREARLGRRDLLLNRVSPHPPAPLPGDP